MMTYLSPAETGSFFSTSFPPFANTKCARLVLPDDASFAPSAAMRTRSGSDSSEYGNSFCMRGRNVRISPVCIIAVSCLELPFLLSLGFIVAETVNGKVVLRKIRIDIAESARLRRATCCTTDKP